VVAAADEGLGECAADVAGCADDEDVWHFIFKDVGMFGMCMYMWVGEMQLFCRRESCLEVSGDGFKKSN